MSVPCVSVIMPVFNKAPYLEQALESVLAQTLCGRGSGASASDVACAGAGSGGQGAAGPDAGSSAAGATFRGSTRPDAAPNACAIELICIDNGSTDGSLDILRAFEARLAQASAPIAFRLLEQDHTGPGVARNAGLDVATGEYVCFLDSDDFLEPVALERALARAEALDADIVVWDTWFFNDRLKRDQHPPVGTLTFDAFVPWDERETRAFAASDNPDAIFTSFQNWPWNKLFRRAFLEESHLRFPPMFRTEDLPFTCMALVRARRMGVVYERLSHYRIHTGSSAMDTKDQHALDFLDALLLLKRELEQAGLFETYRRSFARWALSSVVNNLNPLREPGEFSRVFARLNEGELEALGLAGDRAEEDLAGYQNDFELTALVKIKGNDEAAYLLWLSGALEGLLGDIRAHVDILEADGDAARQRADAAERERDSARAELESTRRELEELRVRHEAMVNSAEYRSGRVLCKLPRAIQRKMLGK